MTYILPIKEIIDETHDTKTFLFEKPAGVTFKPGDHTALSFPNSPNKRPFTFSSAPESTLLEITIKLNGEFTKKLFQKKVGDKLELTPPAGKGLEFEDTYAESLLLLATGSGVTPLISLIRHLKLKNIKTDVVLIFGNKTSNDIIFKKELAALPENFKIVHILSREESINQGHITEDVILKHVSNPATRRWFICGMPPFVKPMIQIARKYISEDKIMAEIWFKS